MHRAPKYLCFEPAGVPAKEGIKPFNILVQHLLGLVQGLSTLVQGQRHCAEATIVAALLCRPASSLSFALASSFRISAFLTSKLI